MSTSAEREADEQLRWKLLASFKNTNIVRGLVSNEFAPLEQQRSGIDQRLDKFLRFADKHIPYYRHKLDIGKDPFTRKYTDKWCAKLPVLTFETVATKRVSLQPHELPQGEAYWETAAASIIPGVSIEHTESSAAATFLLLQREARWNRLNPDAKLGILANSVGTQKKTETMQPSASTSLKNWPWIGSLFSTGPATCLSSGTHLETQLKWLLQERPSYLYYHAPTLGALSRLSFRQAERTEIEVIFVRAAEVSPEDKALAQEAFGARIVEHYILNEFGLIASECEAGRLHVHVEHCHIDLVDEQTQPSKPGHLGHILITGYNNLAMPLIRLVTGRFASVPIGPCACGRTLPSIESLRDPSSLRTELRTPNPPVL